MALRLGVHEPGFFLTFPQQERITRYRAFRCLQLLDIYVASILGLPRTLPRSGAHGDLAQKPAVAEELGYGYGVEDVTEAHRLLMVNLGSYMEKTYFNNKDSKMVGGPCHVHSNLLRDFLETLERWRVSAGTALHHDLQGQHHEVTDIKYVTQIC
jgi:hypothetical protein